LLDIGIAGARYTVPLLIWRRLIRFDIEAEFCQAAPMFRISQKIVAVLLAIWLPLFSGSALAASVAMQAMNGDCSPVIAQSGEHHSHDASAHDQHLNHTNLAAAQAHAAGQGDHHDPSCKNCGVCHLACYGYLATVAIGMLEAQPSAQSFTLSSTQFQSVTSAPLDPPPLALA